MDLKFYFIDPQWSKCKGYQEWKAKDVGRKPGTHVFLEVKGKN